MASGVLAGAASIGCSIKVFLGSLNGGKAATEVGYVDLREDISTPVEDK